MKLKHCLAVCVCLLFFPAQSAAAEPAEKLDRYLNEVFAVVHGYDTEQSSPADRERFLKRLSGLAEEIFDFRIMARMCLAKEWQSLSEAQQDEYVRLFTRFLEGNYFGKILQYLDQIQRFSKENITIVDEVIYSAHRAEVHTVITFNEAQVPIDYRFVARNGPWRIYDICLENISLVQNYRSQFQGLLQTQTSEEFLGRLRQKAESCSLLSKNESADPE